MTQSIDDSPATLIATRVENLSPENDWPDTWRLARICGLESRITSFLFKLLHHLLPTQDRIQRLGVSDGEQPGMCQLCHDGVEDRMHTLFYCNHSQVAGHALLGYAQKLIPDLSPEAALRLAVGGAGLSDEEELASVCLLATGWLFIWETRLNKKHNPLYRMRAELEAMVSNGHHPQED